ARSYEDLEHALSEGPGYEHAAPNFIAQADTLPNDPQFGNQYSLNNTGQFIPPGSPNGQYGTPDADIDGPEAWEVTTGNSSSVVNVAGVIDSGIDYTHPDLYQNIWINQGEIPADRKANLTDTDGDGLITFVDLNQPVNQGVGKITDLNGNGYIDAG